LFSTQAFGELAVSKTSLYRNHAWNLLGNGLPVVLGALSIPVLLGSLGTERFGVLTLIWAIVGYFGLFDLGLGRAITQGVAVQISDSTDINSIQVAKSIVWFGMQLLALLGFIGALLLFLSSDALAFKWLGVSTELHEEVRQSLNICAWCIPLTTLGTGLRGALEGFSRFKESNISKLVLGSTMFGFPVIAVILATPSLQIISWCLVGSRVIALFSLIWFSGKLPTSYFLWQRPSKLTRKRLLSFGSWMALSNLLSPLLVSADRFVISNVLGAGVVAFYTVPAEVLTRLLVISSSVGASLLPALAGTQQSDTVLKNRLYKSQLVLVAKIMFPICTLAMLTAYPLFFFFASEEFAIKSTPIAIVLAIGVFANSLGYIPYTALQAIGAARSTALTHFFEVLVFLPLLYVAVHIAGLLGAALIWSLRTIVDAIALHRIFVTCSRH
jgi:O-antigen/teichoic acid export membrane protein